MGDSPGFAEYLGRLRQLTEHVGALVEPESAKEIRAATDSLESLGTIDVDILTAWVEENPKDVYTLGLSVGLSQEKLKNLCKAQFDTASWAKAAKQDARAVVQWLEDEFALVDALTMQLSREYGFADVLVARGNPRQTAASAGLSGLLVEDQVEDVVKALGLPYEMRGQFTGREGRTAPADVVIPNKEAALIAVACKGFDSTGSKLTDAVTEVAAVARVRLPRQYVFAVVDGIGWMSRQADFRRMYEMFENDTIDGLYALADLAQFEADLRDAAVRSKLL